MMIFIKIWLTIFVVFGFFAFVRGIEWIKDVCHKHHYEPNWIEDISEVAFPFWLGQLSVSIIVVLIYCVWRFI